MERAVSGHCRGSSGHPARRPADGGGVAGSDRHRPVRSRHRSRGEVERRIARMQTEPSGVIQRQTPEGRTLELRRNKLPDGGFVTLYADVTEHKQTEEALRCARADAEAANAAKSRFVADTVGEFVGSARAVIGW